MGHILIPEIPGSRYSRALPMNDAIKIVKSFLGCSNKSTGCFNVI